MARLHQADDATGPPDYRPGRCETLTQTQVKWLGVTLDSKLTFAQQGRAIEKKGTRTVLQLARLARTGWGIPLSQCLQLTSSLVHSRTDYAACVWHRHAENTAAVKAIQRIDNAAQRFSLGVFRTHPLVFLKHDTASAPALTRLNAKVEHAFARILSLPTTNPAAQLVRHARSKPRKAHKTGAHCAFQSGTSTLSRIEGPLETISYANTLLLPLPSTRTLIAGSKAAAHAFVSSQLGPFTKPDPTRVLLFSDGSLIPGEGVGAAALHTPTSTVYPARLGSAVDHTVYEAELVGIRLAAEAARQHLQPSQRAFWFFIDNQASIRALSDRLVTSPALSLRVAARTALNALLTVSRSFSITLVWCPAHVGIQENETVDAAAKEATTEGPQLELPLSLAAVRQQITHAYNSTIRQTPTQEVVKRLRGSYAPVQTRKALMALPRLAAAAIAQLRANHTPLAAFLHRIHAVDSPHCEACKQPETTEHYLLLCRNYAIDRRALFTSLRGLKIPRTTQAILTHPRAFGPLATFVAATKRFVRSPAQPEQPGAPPSQQPPTPSITPPPDPAPPPTPSS